jgi:DNA-binding transcriptional regulator GbsR (MarR family)
MTLLVQAHRKVITYIHLGLLKRRFAIWEIVDGCAVSTSSVTRTLRKLEDLKLVRHAKRGYKGRNYEVSSIWNKDVMKVIEAYEVAKTLDL